MCFKGDGDEACGGIRLVLCGNRYGFGADSSEYVCGSAVYHVVCSDGI